MELIEWPMVKKNMKINKEADCKQAKDGNVFSIR